MALKRATVVSEQAPALECSFLLPAPHLGLAGDVQLTGAFLFPLKELQHLLQQVQTANLAEGRVLPVEQLASPLFRCLAGCSQAENWPPLSDLFTLTHLFSFLVHSAAFPLLKGADLDNCCVQASLADQNALPLVSLWLRRLLLSLASASELSACRSSVALRTCLSFSPMAPFSLILVPLTCVPSLAAPSWRFGWTGSPAGLRSHDWQRQSIGCPRSVAGRLLAACVVALCVPRRLLIGSSGSTCLSAQCSLGIWCVFVGGAALCARVVSSGH